MKTLHRKYILLLVITLVSLVLGACAPKEGDTVVLLRDSRLTTDYNTLSYTKPGCNADGGSLFTVTNISSVGEGGSVPARTVYWIEPLRPGIDGYCSGWANGDEIKIIE